MSQRLIEIIRKANIIKKDEFAKAEEFSKRDGTPFCFYILRTKLAAEEVVMDLLKKGLGENEVVTPHLLPIDDAIVSMVPKDMAYQYRIIPIDRAANNLIVAVGDPTNFEVFDNISTKLGVKLRVRLASELSIQQALDKFYKNREETNTRYTRMGTSSSREGPAVTAEMADTYVIQYVDKLFQVAIQKKASDIHIEPFEKSIRIRLRVDGSLIEYEPKCRFEIRDALISRVKILSKLDISEKRLPQDGNTKVDVPGAGKMDFRVSSLPTVWGEKIVLRLLDKSNLQLDMTLLGFERDQLNQFQTAIFKPFGMVVVTGPTGSGKTTTLYSALNELNRLTDNVVTAEDPVEFTIPGICQVNVRPDIEFTFARALKAFLRQDPDVIMLGEIRDLDTAEIAFKAALTGHIVLSTLHTNNAPESIERLRNMGIDAFTIVSALNAVCAQRLVRKICENCKMEDKVSTEEQVSHGLPAKYAGSFKIYKGEGCPVCNGTGYKGRLAIYEVMTMTEGVKRSVIRNESVIDLKRVAMQTGMQTLRQSAWKKVFKGVTTIAEMLEASAQDFEASVTTEKKGA